VTDDRFGSFFLTNPDAFPEAVAGEAWGVHQRLLDLPGGPFLIKGLSSAQASLIDREYSATVTAPFPSEGCHTTEVLRHDPGFFREFDVNGWEYTLDLDFASDRLRLAALQFAALVPWTDGVTAGLWTSVEDTWFQGVIENYLRVIVAHRLLLRDGLLLHSAGVVLDGSAYLFIGASGAGKSTLARKALESGVPIFSDDLNAVVGLSAEPVVAELPFTGELRNQDASRGTAPLRGVFLLRKGDRISCERMSHGEGIATIVATAPYISRGADNLDPLVAAAATLTARVPVARLTSAADSPFEEIKDVALGFQGSR
jgi:hypothetical protein